MLENVFRKQVIAAILEARDGMSPSYVHLLYIPEWADTLELRSDQRRASAVVSPVKQAFAPPGQLARMVTLDCRLIAPYLLETDPAIDDPLLEASIALAYKEMNAWRDVVTDVAADGSPARMRSVYGWIVTSEDAGQCAARAANLASPGGQAGEVHAMRWFQPEVLSGLWPSLDDGQRSALLGDASWLLCGAPPALQRYTARASGAAVPAAQISHATQMLRPDQWRLIFNSAAASALAEKWYGLCEAQGWRFPDDATQQLHRHIQAAQAYRFDADDLAMYVMTAVQLAPEAMQSDEARTLLHASSNAGIPLRDALEQLPDSFWNRYGRAPA